MVSRYEIRYNRNYQLQDSEKFIREKLSLAADYQAIILPWEDEPFGNRADPYYHRFVPAARPFARAVIYKKLSPANMSLNSVTVKKLLLTAGLLIVLGQGLWQLPDSKTIFSRLITGH